MKPRKRPITVLTSEEVEKIINAAPARKFVGMRFKAMTNLMFRSQLRVSECCNLLMEELDLDRGMVIVNCGKGKKRRCCGVPTSGYNHLYSYLAAREQKASKSERVRDSSFLFCTSGGKPIDRWGYFKKLKQYAVLAGISKRIHPHCLRHSGASYLLESGLNMITIQNQLGHSDLNTTYNYLHSINPKGMLDEIKSKAVF